MNPEFSVYLSLGSNIQPEENLSRAVELLRRDIDVYAVAATWETPAVGALGPNYLNTAVAAQTHLEVDELKTGVLRPIEMRLGRIRTADKNAPRPIDLDIVIHNGKIIEPRLWTYAYLALPISELLPDFVNPETGETLAQVAHELRKQVLAVPHPEVFRSYK